MADFVQKSVLRTASRTLAAPIGSIAAFAAIIDALIADNPLGCTAYMSGSTAHEGVEKSREAYTARFVYENLEAEAVGTVTAKAETVAGFNAAVTAILADTALATAIGGTAVHALDDDSFSAVVKCHDPGGEIYQIAFTRKGLTLSSYEDEAIRAKVETWADTVPALA
jgi:hypothetical protein